MTKQKTQQSKYSQLSDAEKFRIVRHAERYRIKKKLFAIVYKGGKCQKCGYDKCIGALDFHHLDPNVKEGGIIGTTASLEKQREEAKKCRLQSALLLFRSNFCRLCRFNPDLLCEVKNETVRLVLPPVLPKLCRRALQQCVWQ